MEFIKEESEDIKIEETFRVKHEEDTEEQTLMEFIKEENEDIKIEETFRVKHEDTDEQTLMEFIKEENEDIKIGEVFSLKHEDTEEQTGRSYRAGLHGCHSGGRSLYVAYYIRDQMTHQDDIIVLIMIRVIGFFEHTCCV
ncbi:uncharacterized protein LOC113066773 isoform X2 [Carassius auratus]|uniref:Uncharacterized protein LOC113066773 isoform X2 n=1 Tax=Carassius auratus TaxID=7957 RepID=A0A6P6MD34_CARAU|nr:uncharacterized protein LOC113066773 isoform X2 [Carassius auratus]